MYFPKDRAMKLAHPNQHRTEREAFTLVELLVVIAIIIVLVSLLMVGVFKALDSAYQAQTRTDITQIAAAVESFKTKYQVSWVPSRIILCENPANYFNPVTGQPWTPLHQDSLDYLQKIFPRIGSPTLLSSPWGTTGIDWNGDATIADPPLALAVSGVGTINCFGFLLEGEQCLVFFTGGIPIPTITPSGISTTITGFSTNASNPAALTGDRVPPFFEFKSNRLVSGFVAPLVPGFPAYQDGYGKTPYAFFSSYKTANGYNRYYGLFLNSDCASLGVWPYAQSLGASPAYQNAQTYQIISAGKDYTFGLGTSLPAGGPTWAPSYAGQAYAQGVPGGYDDIANFYDKLLGVPTQ
jgi:type II secretory pathway pseudopilin PulG